jgi:hypothetical protein
MNRIATALLLCIATHGLLLAQTPLPAPKADPADFGLILGEGEIKPADGRRVLVPGGGSEPVVGKVHIEIGDRLVVMLPDGRLKSLPTREAIVTERPFVAATMQQLAKELTETRFRGFKTRTTKRYLYVYNTSQPFYEATSRILETMYPALFANFKRRKIAVHEPEVPLVVLMFRTQDEFRKYEPMPEEVAAYYSTVSNQVVMFEQSELVEIAPELAVKQAISTIAHEGVHQVLHNIGVQHRLSSWPTWISEGLPEYFAPTSVDKGIRWKGVGLTNDLRMKSLDGHLKAGGLAAPGKSLKDTVEAPDLTALGYAWAWALTHYLAERKQEAFFAYLAEVSQTGPMEERSSSEEAALFSKHFGDDYAAIEAALIQHLKKLPYADPVANQTHYVTMLQVTSDNLIERRVEVTTSRVAVQQWQQQQRAALSRQSGLQFTVRAFPNRAAAASFADAWVHGR